MRNTKYENGFTLVELIVALMITAIISTAVASLAYALSSANDATGDTSEKQSQIRYVTFRISELVKHCRLICGTPGDDVGIWRSDDNADGQINPAELVYIVAGSARDYVKLLEFKPPAALENSTVSIADIQAGTAKSQLIASCDERYIPLIPECSNVGFLVDTAPPWTQSMSLSFDITENNAVRHYQTNAALRCWAGNLLDESGNIVAGDDD